MPKGLALMLIGALGFILGPGSALARSLSSLERPLGDRDAPWEISARNLSVEEESGIYRAEGDVVIRKGDQVLYAQKAIYNAQTHVAEVPGPFRLESGGDLLQGKEGVFDLESRTARIAEGTLFLRENHYYISGGVMEKVGERSYVITRCRITTCDGPNPDWSITGSEVRVTLEGYGQVKDAAFRVRGIPLLYSPYLIFPAKTKRQTGFLPPRIGYSGLTGMDVEIPFFWVLADQADLTFYQRYLSRRGYMQGVELDYVTGEQSKGIFLFDILSDRESPKDMENRAALELSPDPRTNKTRYWLRGMADQGLPFDIKLRADLDYVSDQDYLLEFERGLFGFEARPELDEAFHRPFLERRSPTRDSTLRISRDGDEYTLQAGSGYAQQPENPPEDETPQPLGQAAFSLMPQRMWNLPLYVHVSSEAGYVWREEGIRGNRVQVAPQVDLPLWLGPYVQFEPSFRYTYAAQWFDEVGEGEKDRESEGGYEASMRLQTYAERQFPFTWRAVERLRHRIAPRITYTFKGYEREDADPPWFESLTYERDHEKSRNLVSLALENYLDARSRTGRGTPVYRQWAYLKLEQGYAIDEARRDTDPGEDREPLTSLKGSLVATPFRGLDLRGSASWDHYESAVTSASVSLDMSMERVKGSRDHYLIEYGYKREGAKNLNLLAQVHLGYGWSVGGAFERNISAGQTVVSSGWVGYDRQCWGIRLGAKRENEDTSVILGIDLLGLGRTYR